MTNKALARVLKETAQLIELTGGNPFRARAFQGASRTLERLDTPAEAHLEAGTLTDIPGIGKGLEAQIREILARGSFDVRDDLLNALPTGLLDVLRVKGLGAKKVRQLWQEADVTSLDALEAAAVSGRIAGMGGFGKKSAESILDNLRHLRAYLARRRYADAVPAVEAMLSALRAHPAVVRAEPAGAFRRVLDTLDAIDLVVATETPDALAEALGAYGLTAEADTYTGAMPDGLPLRIHGVAPARFGTAWWQHTGSAAFCEAFVARYGPPPPDAAEEAAVFAHAGVAVVPPELREDDQWLDAAARDALPPLLTTADLRGNLHNHSTYSDGAHTLREMAEAARALGFAYFGICDHSRSLTIAHGMSVETVRRQHEEIRELNAAFAEDGGPRFRIFAGVESDILTDGSLDYPDDVLASFDFIVASIHSGFNMTEDAATERLIRAIENPYTTILGHPTGRLLLAREGYPVDHERVIAACAEQGVAIEINANPARLDLDWRWVRRTAEAGVPLAINPDAHHTDHLGFVRWGVAVARKGGLTAAQCLNARSLDDFAAWLRARRPAP